MCIERDTGGYSRSILTLFGPRNIDERGAERIVYPHQLQRFRVEGIRR